MADPTSTAERPSCSNEWWKLCCMYTGQQCSLVDICTTSKKVGILPSVRPWCLNIIANHLDNMKGEHIILILIVHMLTAITANRYSCCYIVNAFDMEACLNTVLFAWFLWACVIDFYSPTAQPREPTAVVYHHALVKLHVTPGTIDCMGKPLYPTCPMCTIFTQWQIFTSHFGSLHFIYIICIYL